MGRAFKGPPLPINGICQAMMGFIDWIGFVRKVGGDPDTAVDPEPDPIEVDGVAIYTLNAPGPTQSNVPLGEDEDGRRIFVCTAIAGGAPSAVSLGGQAMTLEYSATLATNRDVRVWSGTPSGTTGDLTITTGNTNAERYAVFRTVGLEASDPDVASTDIENLSDEVQCTTSVAIPAGGGAVLMFARRYLTITGTGVTQDPAAASAEFAAAYAVSEGAATINATYDRTGQGSVNGKIAGAYLLTRAG